MHKLRHVRQWTDCLPDNKGKRPRLNPDLVKVPDEQRLNFKEAEEQRTQRNHSPNLGFIFSKDDPYIGVDVDVDPTGQDSSKSDTIPTRVLDFLAEHPTHAHTSPNGHGLHIIYKLNKWDQQAINELRSLPNQNLSNGDNFTGELRWNKQFLTITPDLHSVSTNTGRISEIALVTLAELIPNLLSHTEEIYEKSAAIDIKTGLPLHVETVSFKAEHVQELLEIIPSTFNYAARKAAKKLKFPIPLASNYDWWITVCSACAGAALELERVGDQTAVDDIGLHFLAWSARDEEGFISARDTKKKFFDFLRSTKTKTHPVSFPMLKKLASLCSLTWPMVNPKTGHPINSEIVNVEALIAHHDMTFLQDTMSGAIVVKGPESIIRRYFCPKPAKSYKLYRPNGESQQFAGKKAMTIPFLAFLQSQGYVGMTAGVATTLAQHLLTRLTTFDYFRTWVESVPWDGHPRVEHVLRTVEFNDEKQDNHRVYRAYIRKSLYALVGMHFHESPFSDVSAFLVFKGRENTRKSSWLRCLLPGPIAEKYMAFPLTDSLISNTDNLMRLLGQKAITIVDECDILFSPRAETVLKSLVSQTADTRRRLYEEEVEHFKRYGVVIGTTNKSELYIGDHGSRKVWQVPIEYCDTDTLYQMDMQQVYAEILHKLQEFANSGREMNLMWTQNRKEVKKTNDLNSTSRKKTELEDAIAELFGKIETLPPFDPEDFAEVVMKDLKGVRCWPSVQLRRLVELNVGIKVTSVKNFNAAITRYCSIYTGTTGQGLLLPTKASKVKGYVLLDGSITYNSRQLFVTPPLLIEED